MQKLKILNFYEKQGGKFYGLRLDKVFIDRTRKHKP